MCEPADVRYLALSALFFFGCADTAEVNSQHALTQPARVAPVKKRPVAVNRAPAPKPPQTPTEPPHKERAAPPASKDALDLAPHFAGTDAGRAFSERRWADAARLFTAWQEQNPKHENVDRARLLGAVAQLYSGQDAEAARTLDTLVERLPHLADTVRYLAADAWLRVGLPGRAIERLESIKRKRFGQAQRASLLRAQALVRLDKHVEAAKAYRAHMKRFAPTASTLLEAAGAERRIKEEKRAARLYRRVVATSPHTRSAINAEKALKDFPKKLRALTLDEQRQRMTAQFDSHKHKAAIQTAKLIERAAKAGSEAWCDAKMRHARSLEKWRKRRKSLAVWDAATAKCVNKRVDKDLSARILYFAGKRHEESGSAARGAALLDRLQKVAPHHSMVDDALLRQADIKADQGATRAAEKLLSKALKVGGDMQEEAAWRLFWSKFERRKYKSAAEVAGRALKSLPASMLLKSRGRLLYWHGRALEKRKKTIAAAKKVYTEVIVDFPVSFYSAMAEERLLRLDPAALTAARKTAQAKKGGEPLSERVATMLKQPDVARAIELTRLGLRSFARAELGRMAGRGKADQDWLLAYLYDRAANHNKAYKIARFSRGEYAQRYPSESNREEWTIAHPRPVVFERSVKAAARAHGIDEALVWAIMRSESGFKPTAHSFANAMGLMQLIMPTAKSMARKEGISGSITRERLEKPDLNIRLGSRYLGQLARRFDGHPALIAAGYNAGPGGPMKWLRRKAGEELDEFVERIPYPETRKYTKSVVTSYLRYHALYGAGQPPRVALRLPRVE